MLYQVYVVRLFEVLPNFLVWQLLEVLPLIAPPRARGRRPRRAVGERFYLKNKARSERNERFAVARIVHSSFFRLRGLFEHRALRTVWNCPHAGRAVASATPSEWYCLE